MLSFRVPTLATNFLILSVGEGLSKILTFATFTYLARVLGPDGFGTVETVLAILFVFNLLVEFGSDKYGAIAVAKDPQQIPYLASRIVALRCLLAVAAAFLLVACSSVLREPWAVQQFILLYGLTLFGMPGLLKWVFQGREQMHWVAATTVLRYAVFAAGVFLWVRPGSPLWVVAGIDLVAVACTVVLNLGIYWRDFGALHLRVERAFTRAFFRQTLPIGLSQICLALKLYLPTLLLGMLMDKTAVGWFGSAHRLVLALNTFGALYLFNLLPALARCAQQSPASMPRLVWRSVCLTTSVSVLGSAFLTLFASPVMVLVYGAQYVEGTGVLQSIIWFVPLALLSGHYRFALVGMGKPSLDLYSTLLGTAVLALLTPLGIAHYGLLGATWAMLGAEIVTWGVAYYFVAIQGLPKLAPTR